MSQATFAEVDASKRVVTLFEAGQVTETSGLFSFERQATIQATNLGPDDYIEFEIVHIDGGEFPHYDACCKCPGEPPAIDSVSTLTCPQCDANGSKMSVKLTQLNPLVILNAPQHTLLRAKFYGEDVQLINVWAVLETNSQDADLFSGCNEDCLPQWNKTGNVRCDVDADTIEYELANQYGLVKWSDPEPLPWELTGRVEYIDPMDKTLDKVQAEFKDPCGDTKWEQVQFQWQPTNDFKCQGFADDSQEYTVNRKYENEYGMTIWNEDATEKWADTGVTRCKNNVVELQQTTICGDVRWFATETPCNYYATYQLDNGGWAYRPGEQDPEATVALEDCDGTPIAYVYPTPRENATMPVTVGCGTCPTGEELLGYAVNSNSLVFTLPKQTTQQIKGDIDSLPALVVNKMPKLEIANFPEQQVFDGIIKYLPELTVGNLETIKVDVQSLPPFVINTFEKDGQLYKLFTDGTYEKFDVVESDRLVRVLYMLNNMPSAGNAPVDLTQYKVGSIARLLPWQNELPDGLRLRGYSYTADGGEILKPGARLNIADNTYVYAIWDIAVIYTSGTDDLVFGMPNDTWHNYNDQVRISHEIPTRVGYRFSGWISSRGDNRRPGDMLRITAPMVLRAKWEAE